VWRLHDPVIVCVHVARCWKRLVRPLFLYWKARSRPVVCGWIRELGVRRVCVCVAAAVEPPVVTDAISWLHRVAGVGKQACGINPPFRVLFVFPIPLTASTMAARTTFAQQKFLPRLPVPDLRTTVERFLLSAKPLLSSQEHATITEQAELFLSDKGLGATLQKRLQDRASTMVRVVLWRRRCPVP